MEVKEILKNLREKNNLTQEQMAERINVTRQAVSRWETGLTQPNPDNQPDAQRRAFYDTHLSQLKHWKS